MSASASVSVSSSPGRSQHAAILIVVYVVVLLLPVILGAFQDLPHRSLIREFTDALLLIGFMALYIQFILSGRFKAISGRFGIDLVMRLHQLMARILAVFLLVHPFLVVRPWESTSRAFERASVLFFTPSTNTGIIAWFLLLILVLVAIFRDRLHIRYEAWRLSHGIGTLAMASLATHHAINLGRHSNTMFITLWLILLALSALTLLYIHVIKPLRKRAHPYHVVSNTQVGDGLWNVTITPDYPGRLEFAAGQFVWLTLGRSPFSINEHPFSIASCPSESPDISFLIKESGDFTSRIGEIQPGSQAYFDGPHGNCTLAGRYGTGICLIAGGAGIAPAMSIIRQLHASRDRRPIRLIYGANREGESVFTEELKAMQEDINLSEYLVLSEPPPNWHGLQGILDEHTLDMCLTDSGRKNWLYFVWGPDVMLKSVRRALRGWGVPRHQIVTERFTF